MAEFQEVCKHLKRMCERYGTNCIDCPLDNMDFCSLSAGDRTAKTYKKAEEIIMSWAAEHPEQVYPTWKEWLEEQRVVVHFDSVSEKGTKVKWELTNKSNCRIPADIAEKLGIKPKEG